ncbi:hypothetical protein [Rathayibacter tanaceti]|nr:hypothetical protein [Rathayibacter tanaceti]
MSDDNTTDPDVKTEGDVLAPVPMTAATPAPARTRPTGSPATSR